VSRAHHCGDPFFALPPLHGPLRKGPEPSATGKAQSGLDGLSIGKGVGLGAVRFVDAGQLKLVQKPPLAVAASAQRSRLGKGECRIVDIAKSRKAVGERLEIGIALPIPSAFPDLSR